MYAVPKQSKKKVLVVCRNDLFAISCSVCNAECVRVELVCFVLVQHLSLATNDTGAFLLLKREHLKTLLSVFHEYFCLRFIL